MKVIRKMREADVPQVARLEVESFPDPWSEKSIEDSLEQTFSICLVAEADEEVTGYLIFYKNLDEGELLRIAVRRSSQRKGVGALLVKELELRCERAGIKRIMLDVRKSNIRAQKFYKKQGFVVDGARKHFYANPDEDAVLMSRRS